MLKIFAKIFISFFVVCILLLDGFDIASAHFLQKDGSISFVLHIDPDDDPVIGRLATLSFEISDEKNFLILKIVIATLVYWKVVRSC